MRIIRQESSTMLDDSRPIAFNGVILHIPRWWTQTGFNDNTIQFERTDTRYDWYSRFSWIEDNFSSSLPDILHQRVEDDELDYDKDDVTIETDSRVLFRNEDIQTRFKEVIRVEGKATEKIENRIYLDLCLIRDHENKGYYVFESRSSVLNGMLEGPFFEEVLAELEIKKNAET